MRYVALGVVAFIIAGFFDLAALQRIRYLKQSIGLVSVLLFGYALVMVARQPDKLPLPAWLSSAGWPFLVISGFLLIYSLFLEIPFRQTYAADGVGDKLVKTGTYALVRHPGVLWLALFLLALVLVSRSRLFLLATPLWIFLDVLYVWIQERFFFGRMFVGYEQYKQETPMLLPTPASIGQCWQSLRSSKWIEEQSRGEGERKALGL
jgi:protein-S-isoprenylcysteine O-methyltransferase Ste14